MASKINKISHDRLYDYVKVNNNTLRINFDGLCQYLFRYEHRQFDVTEFEKILNKEFSEKLIGQPINETTLRNICNYIDELSLYMTAKYNAIINGNLKNSPKEFYKNHQNEYESALRKASRRNPEEFNALRQKFVRRLKDA